MPFKRYVVELGYGADLHGGDATKAATRAVKDAISRSCLCGLFEIMGMRDPNEMHILVRIGCPKPDGIANISEKITGYRLRIVKPRRIASIPPLHVFQAGSFSALTRCQGQG